MIKDQGTIPSLKETLKNYHFLPKKSLGQNFLLDVKITRRIVQAALPLTDTTVIEVGPGPGGLTRALLETDVKKVIAIDPDPRAIEILKNTLGNDPRLCLIQADALSLSLVTLAPAPLQIIANLPYNISTVLLCQWLPYLHHFNLLTLMFQKEVAQRLSAIPASKHYGRLSVMTQAVAEVRRIFDLGPGAFFPAPKVTSSVIQLKPHRKAFPTEEWSHLERLVKEAFAQRRKMLKSNLKTLAPSVFQESHIDPSRRAESLSVSEFLKINKAIIKSLF